MLDAPELVVAKGSSRPLVLIELAELCDEFWSRVDRLSDESAADLFVEEGVLQLGPAPIEGRSAISAFLQSRDVAERAATRSTRHIASNYRLTSLSATRATLCSILTVYAAIGTLPQPMALPSSIGDFVDQFARDRDGEWRFVSRRGRLVFAGEGQPSYLKHPADGSRARP